jgi:hypothetical protein
MPTISIKAFSGLKPVVDPTLLGNGEAVVANNVKLISGALSPLLGTTTLKALTKSAPATIYRYGTASAETDYWLEFTAQTDVMKSPVLNNQYGMLYWSDGSQIKYAPNSAIVSGSTYPGASYNLGIPAPAATPSASGTSATAASQSETRTYVYTYVSAYGEEGPPSAASTPVTINPSASVTLSGMSVAPVGAYNITAKRIYRSSTVGNQAQFQFVAEIAVATTSYTDSVSQANLGETLETESWYAPPAALKGLKMMAGNIALGFVDNTVYASMNGLPHAWPYKYPIDHNIVGIGVFGQTAAILTDGYPYTMSGVDPETMTPERMKLPQACLSKESIVETGDGILYASPDGLVSIGSAGVDILTKALFSPVQWRAYNPASFKAVVYENRYMAFYTKADGTRGLLILDFSGAGAPVIECDINTTTAVTAVYVDPRTDTLYMAQGSNIVRFDRGSALTYTWRSKVYRQGFAINMGYGQVVADAYPVTMKVYADGALRATKTVASSGVFTLPGGYRATDYQIEVTGTANITQANLSTSVEELRQT